MRRNAVRFATALLAAAIALSLATGAAQAAKSLDRPVPGGRLVLKDRGDELRGIKAKLPARCESENGRKGTTKLRVNLRGRLALNRGRFRLAGDAPNGVEVNIKGKRVAGGYKGRVRLTYLDLDFVGPSDDSYLCDTGTVRYRTG